jgi:hypothetical protein
MPAKGFRLSPTQTSISEGTIEQYFRGDKTWQTLNKTAVGLSEVENIQQMPLSYLDTDILLFANSDTKVSSQKAVKTYVDTNFLKLDQTTPQIFTGGDVTGTGLLKVTAGELGLNEINYFENSVSTNKLLGRYSAGTGIVEEITLGANLSFSGNTLNASGVSDHSVLSNLDYASAGHTGFEASISAGTTGQYWRGDKSWQTLDKTAVGLGNVDNVQQQPLDATLTALAELDATAGLLKQTGADTFSKITDNSSNWNTAYGWGNHASGGYFVKASDDTDDITEGTTNLFYTNARVDTRVQGQDYTITGNWTFSEIPQCSVVPTTGNDLVNKTYADSLAGGVTWLNPIISFYDPTGGLPGSPTTGDRYISTATANGWTDKYLYEYNGASWDETEPVAGYAVVNLDDDLIYTYSSVETDWVISSPSTIPAHNFLSGLQGGTASEYYHLTNAAYSNLYQQDQTIKTTSSPTFANITDSGLTASKVVFTTAGKVLTSTGIGTSSQFIKGDGSLDSSTYLTSASTLDASKLSGIIPSAVLGNSSLYIGTTEIVLNRGSGALSLTGVNIDGNAGTVTNGVYTSRTLTINGTTYDLSANRTWNVGIIIPTTNNFRLTLTSGTAVTTSDVTAAGTIYLTPYNGTHISTYDSSVWTDHTSAEISLALTLTNAKNYDVFVYNNSGTLTLELSAAWTNNTTRADAITQQDGVWVKSSDHSRRYVGTIRASATNQTEDSAQNRLVWNTDNRVMRNVLRKDSTSGWTYSGTTWRRANNSTSNVITSVVGLAEDNISIKVLAGGSAALTRTAVGIGVNWSSGIPSSYSLSQIKGGSSATDFFFLNAEVNIMPSIGYSSYDWLEYNSTNGTASSFYGYDMTGINMWSSGMTGWVKN